METSYKKSSEFENYPFLTAEEFAEACHQLDRRYIQAELGPLRRQWKLRVNTALVLAFTPAAEYSTYIQIIRPLELDLDDGDLSAALDKLSFDVTHGTGEASVDADQQMREAEDQDTVRLVHMYMALEHKLTLSQAALHRPPAPHRLAYVTYEIHLHPSYRSPCLWFTLHGLPPDEPAFNIDTVFRRLVPDQYKDGLRNAGPIGGISVDVSLFSFPFHSFFLRNELTRVAPESSSS
jgi:ubiquitin-like-conjugating enzyme ATG10